MKVYNLGCADDHRFEGWFGSEADYDDQRGRGLLACPVCGMAEVRRLPSAPRLNLSQAQDAPPVPAGVPPALAALQAAWLAAARKIAAETENVGERFAEEARRIHYDEAPARAIRGRATPEQAAELREEGIPVARLPLPADVDEPLQ